MDEKTFKKCSKLTLGAFLNPFMEWNTPPPMAPMAKAPPQSSTIRHGLQQQYLSIQYTHSWHHFNFTAISRTKQSDGCSVWWFVNDLKSIQKLTDHKIVDWTEEMIHQLTEVTLDLDKKAHYNCKKCYYSGTPHLRPPPKSHWGRS